MYLVKTFSNKRLCYNKMLNYKQELHEKKKKKKIETNLSDVSSSNQKIMNKQKIKAVKLCLRGTLTSSPLNYKNRDLLANNCFIL